MGLIVTTSEGEDLATPVECDTHITCIECGRVSGPVWRGWRAYRTDDSEYLESPELAFYCPDCAEREFGVTGAGPGA